MRKILLLIFLLLLGIDSILSQEIDSLNYPYTPGLPQPLVENHNPTSKNVLIVYKSGDNVSEAIANYYASVRGIPTTNKIGLTIPDTAYYFGCRIYLKNDGELIYGGEAYYVNGWAAWYYYEDYIHNPVQNYLISTTNNEGDILKNVIDFIVVCKGIPLKIQYMNEEPWSSITTRGNAAVDPLLCLVNQEKNPNFAITDLFGTEYDDIENPYYNFDENNNFSDRFKNRTYFTIFNGDTLSLNYLVTRLDGQNLSTIENMIDNALESDLSGEKTFIIDGDTRNVTAGCSYFNTWYMLPTYNKLNALGFNTQYDYGNNAWITQSTSGEEVIAYTSMGAHAGMPKDYAFSVLEFDYAPGAIFDTYESYSGYSMDSSITRDNHGLVSNFMFVDGTGGSGNTWEPRGTGVTDIREYFPAYAMGYTLAEAAYKGVKYLAWQNVILGDPLTAIAWGKQTLTENKTWEGTNLVAGKITVPYGKTLSIEENAVINFKHFASLDIKGELIVEEGARLNFLSDSSFVISGGSVTANGTAANKIIIDFNSPNETTENSIKMKGGNLSLSNCIIKNAYNGIDAMRFQDFVVEDTEFQNIENIGISLNYFGDPTPWIKNVIFDDLVYGIMAVGGSNLVVKNCSIENVQNSIFLSQVSNAMIVGNSIIADPNMEDLRFGLYLNSSNGYIAKNEITNHLDGIFLANSSPNIADNFIHNNLEYGIYVGSGSLPDLSETTSAVSLTCGYLVYALSGFNVIDENGEADIYGNGSEIYIRNSSIDLEDGCNSIMDDRDPSPGHQNIRLLIDGDQNPYPGAFSIHAENNYWGNNPNYGGSNPANRFGDSLTIYYQPYSAESCEVPTSGSCELVIYDNDSNPVDTLYPVREREGLSGDEKKYAEANADFYSGDYADAKPIYYDIADNNSIDISNLEAYKKLYEIEKMQNSPAEVFSLLS
ncbi:MAG: TIGR03790 family protein, partial [Melioribacteraceae bacterium]|nr:TIGR03790 family protein [Melioribacteraceae bacterium]